MPSHTATGRRRRGDDDLSRTEAASGCRIRLGVVPLSKDGLIQVP